MKQVFNDISQIAHLWNVQSQDHARTSSTNFYFRGDTIYSYGSHFPIAKHVFNDKGESATLFTTRGYSNTTSKHIGVTRQACRNRDIIYCNNPHESHQSNFKNWIAQAKAELECLKRARKPEIYLNNISGIKDQVEKYSEFFSIEIPGDLSLLLATDNYASFKKYLDEKQEQILKAQDLAKKKAAKEFKDRLKRWLNGDDLYLYGNKDYLRIKDGRIETTQNVKIPMEAGKRLWQSICNNTINVGDRLLEYTVHTVTPKEIKIGCHYFDRKYLVEFGNKTF